MPPPLPLLRFDNRALRTLPVDVESRNFVRQVAGACFSRVQPTPVDNPVLVATSAAVLESLGVSQQDLAARRDELSAIFAGCIVPDGADPAAHCYCGHQFGSFAGQLGDGAAVCLGEVVSDSTAMGPPARRSELQLKGSGPTPFSRTADGRKVLRSSLREFLCSEAMAGLGIPTTRAAAIVTSDSRVQRDPLYDGRAVSERCTVVARVAETFLRFGSFEVVLTGGHGGSGASGPSAGDLGVARQLFDFAATTLFPDLVPAPANGVDAPFRLEDSARPAAVRAVLREVVGRTAGLVAAWQATGFVHGVMNTDNMGLTGLTIDYGPFGFMDHFDRDMTPNTSDKSGLYRYSNQPARARWSCLRLAEAWGYACVPDVAELGGQQAVLRDLVDEHFDRDYDSYFVERMRAKLGVPPSADDGDVRELSDAWFALLEWTSADFTSAFMVVERYYTELLAALQPHDPSPTGANDAEAGLHAAAVAACGAFAAACPSRAFLAQTMNQRAFQLRPSISPQQIAHLRQLSETDPDRVAKLFGAPVAAILEQFDAEEDKARRRAALKERAAELGAAGDDADAADRSHTGAIVQRAHEVLVRLLRLHGSDVGSPRWRASVASGAAACRSSNPRFILRQWVAQRCIAEAEQGRFDLTQRTVERLLRPFEDDPLDAEAFAAPPEDAFNICLSCSS